MEYYLGDIVKLRKAHPCGGDRWEVTRIGLDFRIRCCKCAHSVMLPRQRFEKQVKEVLSRGDPALTAALRPKFDTRDQPKE